MIYTESGWAIYDTRLTDLAKGRATLEIHLKHNQPIDFDFRLGHISIVKSLILPPDVISLKFSEGYPNIRENKVESLINCKPFVDVLLKWDF